MHMNNGCVNKKVDVFMDKSVVQKINSLIHRDPFHECGGIFIGNYITGVAVPKPAGNWETPILATFSPAMYLISEAEMVL